MRRAGAAVAVAAAAVLAAAGGGWALASGGVSDVTFAGCLSGGKLANVQVTRVPSCSASATPVQWAGQAIVSSSPSPSPSPSVSPTVTPPPSPSPSPTGTGSPQCVVTQSTGTPCGLAADPAISNSNGSNTQAGNNCWADPSCTFTSTFYGAARWDVQATEPAGNTSVKAYPTVQQLYDYPAVSSLPSLTSSYAENMNATAGTIAWAAYDVWLNSWGVEVLIAVDNHGIDPSYLPVAGHFTSGGQAFTLYDNGSERVVVADASSQSGTVNIADVLTHVQALGKLPAAATLDAVDFGWEICSTGGQPEDFQVTGYTLSDN